MKALAWIGYFLGFGAMMAGQVETGGLIFLFSMLLHWRWWIIALPFGVVAFVIGANWNKDG